MGDGGSPNAGAGTSPESARALEALRLHWDEFYMLGCDEAHGWWAARRDQVGGYLTGDGPESLRQAMADDHAVRPAVPLWCRWCGQPVTRRSGRAVHARTGGETGMPDGHRTAPVTAEPALWKAAREISADYGGAFTVDARFGFLRAEWARVPAGVTAPPFRADTGAEMRALLEGALALAGREGAGR